MKPQVTAPRVVDIADAGYREALEAAAAFLVEMLDADAARAARGLSGLPIRSTWRGLVRSLAHRRRASPTTPG